MTTVRLRAALVAAAFAIGLHGHAHAQKEEVRGYETKEVCFRDKRCVKVEEAYGLRVQGVRSLGLPSSMSWVSGVYDANGKVVGRVKKGGDIVVISPEAYARRDGGQTTYTIHRLDGSGKPVKTPFVAVISGGARYASDTWRGESLAAIGMTERPRNRPPFAGVFEIAGKFGGIAPDGTVTSQLPDVKTVYYYGDYHILQHTDGASFTIADENFRLLSPRLDNLKIFITAFDETMSDLQLRLGGASQKVVFALPAVEATGSGTLYSLLPRTKGDVTPAGMVGLAPVLTNYGQGQACMAAFGPACRAHLRAWIGVWASDSGEPVVSVEEPLLRRISSDRFRAVHWYPSDALFIAGVAQTLQGDFRVLPYKVEQTGDMTLSMTPERYATLQQANAAIKSVQDQRSAQLWATYFADRQLAAQRYAAWESARADEERQKAARAAAEDQENRDALALIATNDADRICKASWSAEAFYARTNLMDACARLRPPPAPVSRGFWGDLAAGLAAYNQSGAAAAAGSSYSGAASSGGSLNSGDFNRSMQSIDNALRVISDPNWNGAAAAAGR